MREIYRVKRGVVGAAELPKPGGHTLSLGTGRCLRCGATCSPRGLGQWGALTVLSRIRGTLARGVQVHVVHIGCVPTDLSVPRGVPARKGRRG